MAAYLTSLPDSRACCPKRSKARSEDRRPTSAFSWSFRVSHAEKGGRSAFRRRLRLFRCSILVSCAFAILHLMFLWGPETPACGGILRLTRLETNHLSITEARIYGPGDPALALVAELFRAKPDPSFVFMFPPFLRFFSYILENGRCG